MAKLPTDKAATNNAAKDDVVGLNGDYDFTIKDLLANDPGGANKNGNFFFGDSAGDQAKQAQYLADHHITKISDVDGGTYHVDAGATDFNYFVQIGGNGTWSEAHVHVAGTPAPVDTHHVGDQIAKWDFEDTSVTDARGYQQVSAPNGWFNVSDYAEQNNLGTYAKTMEVVDGTNGPATGFGAGEHQWLDTAASPGNIWIQLSEANRTTNIQHDAQLTFSVAKQDLGLAGHTDPNASVEFYFNYELVGTVKASELNDVNQFHEFSAIVHANDSMATDQLFIKSSGTAEGYQGLAIDHIMLHDWLI
jgi:hypothetical protein